MGTAWEEFYRATLGRPPRELMRRALQFFPAQPGEGRLAIDIGCGAGVEARELLRQGWRVLAIDSEPLAIERLRASVDASQAARLETHVGSVAGLRLPPAEFIWAGLSLPFISPQAFPTAWSAIVAALKPGGRFAGDFFGTRDEWATDATMNFHTMTGLRKLLRPLHLESLSSEYGLRHTASGHWKKSQVFAAIARVS